MAKRALCIGINDYPGTQSDLYGCVNDAMDWKANLEQRGFSVDLMLDSQATKENMKVAMGELVTDAKAGDSVVITYSGHGTYVPDTSGDEPDGRDEGLCPHDISQGNVLLDDEINQLFSQRKFGAKIILISDSCHSGSVTRWAPPEPDPSIPRPRFLPPEAWIPKAMLAQYTMQPNLTAIQYGWKPPAWIGSLFLSGGDLLMSGCQDHEYSYDARFGGRPNGAFSYYALQTLQSLGANASYQDWFNAIRDYLPGASYPQTPQIFGAKQVKNSAILK